MTYTKIRSKDRNTILQSLRGGVTPNRGLQHVQVGRIRELEEMVKDLDVIADGGASFRLIVGEYGSGKTFFLNLTRAMAMEKKMVTASADLHPGRRLHATGGQAQALYCELMRNLSTRAKPNGGALPAVVERFIASVLSEAKTLDLAPEALIREKLEQLQELVGGYDFAEVIATYWRGFDQGDDQLKSDALRWLRGEFNTKTDARKALGVRKIIEDANVYDTLKLLARFFRLAGYQGFLVSLDEMVNLFKLNNSQARKSNYEQILRILNDCLQGNVEGLGILLGGTPEFLMDPRKGLYSYEALQTRLAQNSFATQGLVDFSGPVITLANLVPEDMNILLDKIRWIYFQEEAPASFPDEAIKAFMKHCHQQVGEAYFRTPRNTIKAFIDLLATLEQNPETNWQKQLGTTTIEQETETVLNDHESPAEDDELVGFKL